MHTTHYGLGITAAVLCLATIGPDVASAQTGTPPLKNVIGQINDREAYYVDATTFQVAKGLAKGKEDPAALIQRLKAAPLPQGAIIFRAGDTLYLAGAARVPPATTGIGPRYMYPDPSANAAQKMYPDPAANAAQKMYPDPAANAAQKMYPDPAANAAQKMYPDPAANAAQKMYPDPAANAAQKMYPDPAAVANAAAYMYPDTSPAQYMRKVFEDSFTR